MGEDPLPSISEPKAPVSVFPQLSYVVRPLSRYPSGTGSLPLSLGLQYVQDPWAGIGYGAVYLRVTSVVGAWSDGIQAS